MTLWAIALLTLGILLLPAIPPVRGFAWKWLLWFPPLNAAADMTTNYFPPSTVNPGSIRAAILLGLIVVTIGGVKRSRMGLVSYLLCAYLLLISLLSSNPAASFVATLKVVISISMLILCYSFVDDLEKLRKLLLSTLVAVFVIGAVLAWAQLFQSGQSAYLPNTLFLGGGDVQISYTLLMFLLVAPLIASTRVFSKDRSRGLFVSAAFISLLGTILIVRRGAYLGLLSGVLSYLWAAEYRKRAIVAVFVLGLGMLFIHPLYEPILSPVLQARTDRFQERGLESEGRIREFGLLWEEIQRRSLTDNLLGSDLFNSGDYLSRESYSRRYRNITSGRQFHVDWNILVHGSGFFGLFLYVWLHVEIWRAYRKASRQGRFRDLRAVFLAVAVSALALSISGSILSLGYRALMFAYLGALIRLMEETKVEQAVSRPERTPAALTKRAPPSHSIG